MKTMLEETPAALPGIKGHELLIEGIVIRLSFTETPRVHYSEVRRMKNATDAASFGLKGDLINHNEFGLTGRE